MGLLEAILGAYLDAYVAPGLKDLTPFIFMLIILLVKPYGLFGIERIERV